MPGQRQVKRVIAEMGGKNAIVVDADADLDEAVPAVVGSRVRLRGPEVLGLLAARSCVDAIHDAVRRAARRGGARRSRIGHPADMGADDRPAHRRRRARRASAATSSGRARRDGRSCCRRDDLPDRGYFVGPTIVDRRRPGSPLVDRGDLRPGAGRAAGARLRRRHRARQRHRLRPDRRDRLALPGAHRSAPRRSCGPATSTSTGRSPAPSSAASPSAASGSPASGRRRAAPTTCCSSSSPGDDREHAPPGLRARRPPASGRPDATRGAAEDAAGDRRRR